MRVIAGKYKGYNLFTLDGKRTRPTMDAMKETIFSVLYSCEELNVLDLYSGSGSLGLEAISRGANCAELVEASDKAFKVMLKNVDKLKCSEKVLLHKKRVNTFLNGTEKVFDVVFMDPPYDKQLVNVTIQKILDNKVLAEDGILVVEHSPRERIWSDWKDLIRYEKQQGRAKITILDFSLKKADDIAESE